MAFASDGHLLLRHHLEQCGLHLGRRPVDLIGEHEVGEHRAQLDVEAFRGGPVDARADHVGGEQVGRELDPGERPPDGLGHRLHGECLGKARHALEQDVAVAQKAREHALQRPVLPHDHLAHLEQQGLHPSTGRSRIEGRRGFAGAGSRGRQCSGWLCWWGLGRAGRVCAGCRIGACLHYVSPRLSAWPGSFRVAGSALPPRWRHRAASSLPDGPEDSRAGQSL